MVEQAAVVANAIGRALDVANGPTIRFRQSAKAVESRAHALATTLRPIKKRTFDLRQRQGIECPNSIRLHMT